MENVYKENGCLFVVPGSHRGELYIHRYPVSDVFKTESYLAYICIISIGCIVSYLFQDNKINKAYHGIQNEFEIAPESERVYLPMEKGDTVFFHPTLVHGSGPNTTNVNNYIMLLLIDCIIFYLFVLFFV